MKKYILLVLCIAAYLDIAGQCADNGNYWNQSWTSCTTSENPNTVRGKTHWILYEFHTNHFIDSTWIWNANRAGESGWGAKDVVIDYSLDEGPWIELGQYEFPKANESEDYEGFEGPGFNGEEISKILITILSTHDGGNCASLAEFRIGINEDACYGILDVCGVCDGPGELIWYLDADNDGLGDANNSITDCEQPDGYVDNNSDLCDNGALGWDDIGPLFSENGCNGCHGGSASGGLDLRSFESTMMGGNKCGSDILAGDNFVRIIVESGYDACGSYINPPSMNSRASGEFDEEELAQLQAWINGGAPELCTEYNFNVDMDQDGYNADVDCDDMNADINPGAEEIPDNGIDEDCDGSDLITSIHEINDYEVAFYPNPVSDRLNIVVEGDWDYQIRLLDVTGKLVLQKMNITTLDVSDLKGGIYILELQEMESKQKIVEQVVVVR